MPLHVHGGAGARNTFDTYLHPAADVVVVVQHNKAAWLTEYKAFLNAFFDTDIVYAGDGLTYKLRNHPNLMGYQIQGFGTGNGEMSMRPDTLAIEEGFGLVANFENFYWEYHHAHIDAIGEANAWKLVTVMKGDWLNSVNMSYYTKSKYTYLAKNPARSDPRPAPAARGAGMGNRPAGNYERYETVFPWFEQVEVDANGILQVYDSNSTEYLPYLRRAEIHNQAENWWGTNKNATYVTTLSATNAAHCIRMSMLRVVAERYTHCWANTDDLALVDTVFPGHATWLRAQLARNPGEDFEAFCWLGEAGTIKAIGRALKPTNITSTTTDEDTKQSLPGQTFVDGNDYLGRKPSAAGGYIGFNVDSRFQSGSGTVEVVVTYFDDTATWKLTVGADESSTRGGGGSNSWKSVALNVPGFTVSGSEDFRITAVSGQPIIQYVRVVQLSTDTTVFFAPAIDASSSVTVASISTPAPSGTPTVGTATKNSAGGSTAITTIAVNKPNTPTLADDDHVVIALLSNNETDPVGSYTPPSGFTQALDQRHSSPTGLQTRLVVWYKHIASAAGEPATYSPSWPTGCTRNIIIAVGVRDALTTTFLADSGAAEIIDSGSLTTPALTASGTNNLLLGIFAAAYSTNDDFADVAPPPNFQEIDQQIIGSRYILELAAGDQVFNGEVPAKTAAFTSPAGATTIRGIAATLVINAAGGTLTGAHFTALIEGASSVAATLVSRTLLTVTANGVSAVSATLVSPALVTASASSTSSATAAVISPALFDVTISGASSVTVSMESAPLFEPSIAGTTNVAVNLSSPALLTATMAGVSTMVLTVTAGIPAFAVTVHATSNVTLTLTIPATIGFGIPAVLAMAVGLVEVRAMADGLPEVRRMASGAVEVV